MQASSSPTTVSIQDLLIEPPDCENEVLVRLYLVRHGETEANLNKLVAGQSESPLTNVGIQQANALGSAIQDISFDKLFVSDMERAVHSAHLMALPNEFLVERRLREMAKGAREGLPKSLTYDDAVSLRNFSDTHGDNSLPLLESDEDVWKRVSEWLVEVIKKAVIERRTKSNQVTSSIGSILVMTHSGIIRTICSQLVHNQLPESISTGKMGRDGATGKHLEVPNTSLTILDVTIRDSELDLTKVYNLVGNGDAFECKLRLLTWCGHFHAI